MLGLNLIDYNSKETRPGTKMVRIAIHQACSKRNRSDLGMLGLYDEKL